MIEIYRIKYNTKWTDWTQICSTDYIDALEFDECKVSSEGGKSYWTIENGLMGEVAIKEVKWDVK